MAINIISGTSQDKNAFVVKNVAKVKTYSIDQGRFKNNNNNNKIITFLVTYEWKILFLKYTIFF